MKIIIDNPCHENWDAMSPNEKGAFCLSCQKTVIDFSIKTVQEIKNFFVGLPQTETVCGRFKEEQLDEISFEHFFNQFKGWKFFQKAALITFFVFGFSLFGGAQVGPKHKSAIMKGEAAVYTPRDTTKTKVVKKDKIKVEEPTNNQHMMGGPRYIPDPEPKPKVKQELMGKPSVKRENE